VLSCHEFWCAVIALLCVPLLFLLRTVVDKGEREDAPHCCNAAHGIRNTEGCPLPAKRIGCAGSDCGGVMA
jgi:hypothetical protein